MNKGDQLIESGAVRLEELSRKAAAKGGVSAKLADDLLEDAAFLRKLKPSLIAARAKGEAPTPTNQDQGGAPAAPSAPQIAEARPPKPKRKPKPKPKNKSKRPGGKKRGGPNPFLIAGAALVAGILLAKVIDWRGHAHPRD